MIGLFFLFSKLSFDYHNKQLLQQLPLAEAKIQMAILKLESEQAIKTKDKIKTSKNLIRVNTRRIAKFKEDILSSNNYREISEFCEHIKDEVKKNELGDYQLYSEMNKG